VKRADGLVADGVAASLAAREEDAADFFLRADSLYGAAERLDRNWVTPTIGRGWVALRFALSPERLVPFRPARGDTTSPAIRMPLRAIALADQALRASSGSAPALALRGYAREWLGTWPGASGADTLLRRGEADLRAAVDARPDDARSWYALGDLLFLDGRFAEANAALQQAYDGDAYLGEVRAVVNLLFFVALNQGEFTSAERWCGVGEHRFPEDPRFRPCRLMLLAWSGSQAKDVAAAWQGVRALEVADSAGIFASQWGAFRMLVAMVAARSGLSDSATAIMGAVHAGGAAHPGSSFRAEEARVRLLLGRREEAVRLLAEELRDDPLGRGKLLRSPWFREVAGDPALRPALLSAP
jgi:tetratricopeptide (TPR) repeat protein